MRSPSQPPCIRARRSRPPRRRDATLDLRDGLPAGGQSAYRAGHGSRTGDGRRPTRAARAHTYAMHSRALRARRHAHAARRLRVKARTSARNSLGQRPSGGGHARGHRQGLASKARATGKTCLARGFARLAGVSCRSRSSGVDDATSSSQTSPASTGRREKAGAVGGGIFAFASPVRPSRGSPAAGRHEAARPDRASIRHGERDPETASLTNYDRRGGERATAMQEEQPARVTIRGRCRLEPTATASRFEQARVPASLIRVTEEPSRSRGRTAHRAHGESAASVDAPWPWR